MPELQQEAMKGTTTVGLIFDGGVILATEKRATMGLMIASKKAKKVYQIADRIGMTTAGGVGDAQQLARIITVECNLYQIRRSRPITVSSASNLLSTYLNQNRYYPYYVQLPNRPVKTAMVANVVAVPQNAEVSECALKMKRARVDQLPVINGDKKLVSMLYDRELIRAFCTSDAQ